MPFLYHLDELRRRIIIIALTIGLGSAALYPFAEQIRDVLLKPVLPHIPDGKVSIFGPFEAFTFNFKVALYATLVLASPIIIWQVLAFFLPALKPKEQRYFIPTFIAAIFFFAAGNLFCYSIILDPGFGWLIDQGEGMNLVASGPAFVNGVTLFMLGFGIAFELPIVIFYLLAFGIVPYKTMRKNWRIAYVILMVVASIATPDWSPVTMGMLFGALVVLYEGSLALARVVLSKRIAAQKAMGY
ncbi:MAG: twin-arginine translocase subunit TatC [Coriobacteriia bacterium]|nr:twin-arginine translocase subunit TatC [Coriobacteriia bacterium]